MAAAPKAVVLLSGGLDSATCLAIARDQGFEPCALSFRYGQRHAVELEAARRIARSLEVTRHEFVEIDLRPFGGSALTDAAIPVPKDDRSGRPQAGIPVTYVPARNTIFLSFALAFAEVLPADDIFIGVNALDYSGYPDCRPDYVAAFQTLADLATRAAAENGRRITIHAPLIAMTKARIIATGQALGVDYGLTVSCYDPGSGGEACGRCDACALRLAGFAEAGLRDPATYMTG